MLPAELQQPLERVAAHPGAVVLELRQQLTQAQPEAVSAMVAIKPWENHRETHGKMGKPWENHGKIWENIGTWVFRMGKLGKTH